jgi:allophanate hydrolase subunit 2
MNAPRDISSLGVFPGVVQIPPDGQPILLMADAQPTGGYPIVAVVIQADLHRAAQLLPGDVMRFELTTLREATAAWQALRAQLDVVLEEDEGLLLATNAGRTGADAMLSDLLEWRPDVNIA